MGPSNQKGGLFAKHTKTKSSKNQTEADISEPPGRSSSLSDPLSRRGTTRSSPAILAAEGDVDLQSVSFQLLDELFLS